MSVCHCEFVNLNYSQYMCDMIFFLNQLDCILPDGLDIVVIFSEVTIIGLYLLGSWRQEVFSTKLTDFTYPWGYQW